MEWLRNVDFAVLDGIRDLFGSPLMDRLMPAVSLLGEYGIVSIVLCAVLLSVPKTRRTGVSLAVAMLLGLLFGNGILKPLVGRLRPYQVRTDIRLLIPYLTDGSFPSGHALISFETASVLFLRCRRAVSVPVLVLGTAVAFSRLYLYMHFPSDVLAGVLLGTFFGWIGCRLADRICERAKEKNGWPAGHL